MENTVQPDLVSIGDKAVEILGTSEPAEKVALSLAAADAWRTAAVSGNRDALPPNRPARPIRPELHLPRDMPRRRTGGAKGRIALLHALAHIELNAIDLAWDMVARFGGGQPDEFIDDWVTVAAEEAKHHALLAARLAAYGAAYGELPAHDGLWEAAEATSHDLLARLAVVPLVLEARGLDVTPAMILALERAGDRESAAVVRTIYEDEIKHVATGHRWFFAICQINRQDPVESWQHLVARYFKGQLKPPFNHAARDSAGFDRTYYDCPIAGDTLTIGA